MITTLIHNARIDGKALSTVICLSTDTKPNGFVNGSKLLEIDTSKRYMFDEEHSRWLEVTNSLFLGGLI